MAHENAHEDKGHVAELQTIGAGVGIASLLLNQISRKRQLVTTPEIKTGMTFYALPWIPSKPAQGMISPPAARHALASALTEGVGFERSGGKPRKPSVNVRQSTTNEGGEMSG